MSSRSPLPVQSEKLCCCIFYASDSAYNFLFKKKTLRSKNKNKDPSVSLCHLYPNICNLLRSLSCQVGGGEGASQEGHGKGTGRVCRTGVEVKLWVGAMEKADVSKGTSLSKLPGV